MSIKVDVVVIGAGVSGLAAAKCLQDDGFNVIVLERTTQIGGLWRFREKDYGVMRFTRINVSKYNYCFSDYPYPDSAPDYPLHSETVHYLEDYARATNVSALIEFQVKVRSVEKEGDKWKVTGCRVEKDGKTELDQELLFMCKYVAIATGHHTKPNWPKFTGQDTFPGEMIHSVDFKDATTNNYTGKKVLVVGIGNSAVDVAVNCVTEGRCPPVHISSRSGGWVIPSYLFGYPMDLYACRFFFMLPYCVRNFLFATLIQIVSGNPFRWGLNPTMKVLQTQLTVSPTLIHHLQSRNIKVVPNIKEIVGRRVVFKDGSSETFDKIVCCTGYKIDIPFLSDSMKKSVLEEKTNTLKLYKNVFSPALGPSVAFIGFVQPATGGTLPMSEMQARWFSHLCKGAIQLPSRTKMEESIAADVTADEIWWHPSTRHTIQRDPIPYVDEIASFIGAKPRFADFPSLGWRLLLSSCGTYQWRLRGPHKWPAAEKYVRKVPLTPFLNICGAILVILVGVFFMWLISVLIL